VGIVRRLPSDLIDRIAAGEVIERPASVAKELLENALDAGASSVEVEIAGGGLERIAVIDDGSGMDPDDAALALERHATSKLASADDLFNIKSLGFRGEALSSIAAVSRLTLTTRPAARPVGTRVVIEGGEVKSVSEVGCPAGTSLEVSDLFFNTPARRKFMRAPATEQAHIVDACTRVILGSARAGIAVTAGGRRLLDVTPGAGAEERARSALAGRAESLYAFDGGAGEIRVHGMAAPPGVDRADAKGLWILVGGRFVRDRTIQRAVADAYRAVLTPGRYPVGVVHVEVPPSAVDVNVHPQKLEVRFADSAAVYRAVSAALTTLLAESPWLGGTGPRRERPVPAPLFGGAGSTRPAVRYHFMPAVASHPGIAESGPRGWFGSLVVVARAGAMLIGRRGAEAILVDTAAARELVVAARLRAESAAGAVEPRALLFPEVLETTREAEWSDRARALEALSFGIEPTGPGRFVLRSVPAALGTDDTRRLVEELLEDDAALDPDALIPVLARWAGEAAGSLDDAELARTLNALDALDLPRDELAALARPLDEASLRRCFEG
jgi:DNA mismatch repair protein MutL